jgi:hypothetical protein
MSCTKKKCTNKSLLRSNYDMAMLNSYNTRENFTSRSNEVMPTKPKYPPVPGVGTADRYERTATDLTMNEIWNNKSKTCCSQVRNKEYYIGPRTQFDMDLQNKWVKQDVPNCTYSKTVENYGYQQSLEDPYNYLSYTVYKNM